MILLWLILLLSMYNGQIRILTFQLRWEIAIRVENKGGCGSLARGNKKRNRMTLSASTKTAE